MKFGVVVFPGSNCDHDAFYAISNVLHQPVEFIWHQSEDLANSDAVILPGGFAHGDYLRTGAIARFSPVMKSVEKFAEERRAGAGNLQRLSNFAGSWPFARRRDAQCRLAIYLPPRAYSRGQHRYTVYPRREAGADSQNSHRAQRWKLHLRSANACGAAKERPDCFSLHHGRRHAMTPPEIPMDRWITSPASAIASATSPD